MYASVHGVRNYRGRGVFHVVLNALFLLGTWRYSQLRLGAGETPLTAASFDAFFDKQAADWKFPAATSQVSNQELTKGGQRLPRKQ